MKSIIVFGSVHLDVLAMSTNETAIDKPGSMHIDIGGCAFNVACNLATNEEFRVYLVTALNQSSLSSLIISEIISKNIIPHIITNNELGHSGFSAHLTNGDLSAAVAAIQVEKHTIQITADLRKLIGESDIVVMDCNLNERSIKNISRETKLNNKKIAICAVSETKSTRIYASLPPDYLFFNQLEHKFYSTDTRHENSHFENTFVFVTKGKNGAICYEANQPLMQMRSEPRHVCPGERYLGAGDAFAAGAIRSLLNDPFDIHEALVNGIEQAEQSIIKSSEIGAFLGFVDRQITILEQKANTDTLTGACSRGSLDIIIKKLPENKLYSILFCDIDHFKSINDSFGHPVGDLVLSYVADIMKESIRSSDHLVRWGGEEFVIIASCNEADAIRLADRLCTRLSESKCEKINRPVTLSIGIASHDIISEIEMTIVNADNALYEAKNSGRNQWKVA
jgi:diguanylate cyclase (GGDEF)-like protein